MFNRNKTEDVVLQSVIEAHVAKMTAADSKDEYQKLTDQFIQLTTLKSQNSTKPMSKDTLILAAGNLAGILTIVIAENKSVITSKALGFILKAR